MATKILQSIHLQKKHSIECFLITPVLWIRFLVIPEVAGTLMVLRKTLGNVCPLEFISLRYRHVWLWYG